MITYQKERFIEIMKELPPLFVQHYDEIALDKEHMLLEPAWQAYVNLDMQGALIITTARNNGILIG